MNLVRHFFLFSRLAVVSSRPLLLFYVVMQEGAENEAVSLTLLITVAVSFLMLANVDAHREFYKAYFSKDRKHVRVVKEYVRLLCFFTGLLPLLFTVYFLVTYLLFESFLIALLFSVNVIIEKIFDEFQRFTIFEKRYLRWSCFALVFWLGPVLVTLTIYEISAFDIVKTFVLSSLVVYLGVLTLVLKEVRFIRVMKRFNLASLFKIPQASLRIYISRFNYLLANFAVGHVLVVTRYGVLIVEPVFLPVYVLFMQCGGVISSLVDMLYLAFRRERFVRRSDAAFESLKDRELLNILSLGVLVSFSACLVMSFIKYSSFYNYLGVLAVVISMCIVYTISTILFESIFWHRSILQRLVIEFIYFLLIGIVMLLATCGGLSLMTVLAGFLACCLIRIVTQTGLIKLNI